MLGTIGLPEVLFMPVFLVLIAVHFLPTIVAVVRHHPKTLAIVLINIFLGWTVIGWVVALIWAFVSQPATSRAAA